MGLDSGRKTEVSLFQVTRGYGLVKTEISTEILSKHLEIVTIIFHCAQHTIIFLEIHFDNISETWIHD